MTLPQYMQDDLDARRATGATIVVKTSAGYSSAALHVYWDKDPIMALVLDGMPSGVRCYPDGTLARLIGALHPRVNGNSGMDVMAPPTAQDITEDFANYAVGSKGVIVVDCESSTATCYAGTLATDYPTPVELPDAPPMM